MAVDVAVIAPVIVAVHVNGNETVIVIVTVVGSGFSRPFIVQPVSSMTPGPIASFTASITSTVAFTSTCTDVHGHDHGIDHDHDHGHDHGTSSLR